MKVNRLPAEAGLEHEGAQGPNALQELFELVPSADLSRTRRNFLFANSLLMLIAVVNPPRVSIPGFGAEGETGSLAIDGGLAIAAVLAGSLLFWWEYWIEYRITRWRNNSIFGGRESENIDAALLSYRRENQSLISEMKLAEQQFEKEVADVVRYKPMPVGDDELPHDMQNAIAVVSKLIHEAAAHILLGTGESDSPVDLATKLLHDRFYASIEDTRSEIKKARDGWVERIDSVPRLKGLVTNAIEKVDRLNADLNALHRQINRFQGNAFVVKDLVLPASFLGAAIGLVLYRFAQRGLGPPELKAWAAAMVGAVIFAAFARRAIFDQFGRRRPRK